MSFAGDSSSPLSGLQGMATGIFSSLKTLLGGIGGGGKERGAEGPEMPLGKKPKGKSPVASFLGSDMTPGVGGGSTLLGG